MNTAARIGVYLMVFATGGGIGGYVGYRFAEARAFAHEMAEVSRLAADLHAQRTKGSDVAYESALRAYLASIEFRSRGPAPIFSDRVYAMDAALAYVRLSMLAAKRGAKDEAAIYLKKAADLCPQIESQDCSAATLTEMAAQLDRGRLTR